MAKKSRKKNSSTSNNNNNKKSLKTKYVDTRKKQWYCFGTMTILSNHKRTAEKYLNILDDEGIRPEEIKIYQGKGQGAGGYSRINICYYAKRRILNSRF